MPRDPASLSFILHAQPDTVRLEALNRQLTLSNAAQVGPSERKALAVFVHADHAGVDDAAAHLATAHRQENTAIAPPVPTGPAPETLCAALSGYTGWGWLYIQQLWVAESLRGAGVAGQMLTLAEDEARHRGCHHAHIDTFNPVALRSYQKQGYRLFGTLPDFPYGHTRSFLYKALS